jgi:hypothetical protein
LLVEEDVLGIVDKLQAYDSNLKVQYFEGAPSVGDPPFRIVEVCADGEERTVFYAWQLDDNVIRRVAAADNQKRDVLLGLDKTNEAARRRERRRYEDRAEADRELVGSIVKSSKDTYRYRNERGQLVKFKA